MKYYFINSLNALKTLMLLLFSNIYHLIEKKYDYHIYSPENMIYRRNDAIWNIQSIKTSSELTSWYDSDYSLKIVTIGGKYSERRCSLMQFDDCFHKSARRQCINQYWLRRKSSYSVLDVLLGFSQPFALPWSSSKRKFQYYCGFLSNRIKFLWLSNFLMSHFQMILDPSSQNFFIN